MIQELSREDVADILYGATMFGAGGGGDLAEGFDLIDRAVAAGKTFRLATLADVEDTALIATSYLLGALPEAEETAPPPEAYAPSAGEDHPLMQAHVRMEAHLGRAIEGAVACELGGSNTAVPFFVAAMTGGVVIDADPAGRAVPEITHSAYYLAGLSASPIAAANGLGEAFLLDHIADDRRAETVVRALCQVSGNDISVVDHALPAAELKGALIEGTLSRARTLGAVWREGRSDPPAVVARIAREAGARRAFEGRVTQSDARVEAGFTVGAFTISGTGQHAGSTYRIELKNENMVGWRDGLRDACIPDIITVFDLQTGAVLTNPHVKVGALVAVLVLPAPKVFSTPRGRAILGPTYLGLED
ncbi:MAG: DUF917 domain-containing protein [Pseudomonadota bacterium]